MSLEQDSVSPTPNASTNSAILEKNKASTSNSNPSRISRTSDFGFFDVTKEKNLPRYMLKDVLR